MLRKMVYRYDNDNIFIEPLIAIADGEGNFNVPENCTDVPLPVPGLYKARFDEGQQCWIESASTEEIEQIKKDAEESAHEFY